VNERIGRQYLAVGAIGRVHVAIARRHGVGLDLLRPRSRLIFHGTSNSSPWDHEVRHGDNHWTNGIFAQSRGGMVHCPCSGGDAISGAHAV
jgi:hypothetical protein